MNTNDLKELMLLRDFYDKWQALHLFISQNKKVGRPSGEQQQQREEMSQSLVDTHHALQTLRLSQSSIAPSFEDLQAFRRGQNM